MILIDGKKVAKDLELEIASRVGEIKSQRRREPHLAAVLVGDEGASLTYVKNKIAACERVGFRSSLFRFPSSVSEKELLALIQRLNVDDELDGYIVQLPLPQHISEERLLMSVNPEKDVDGFHPLNFGKIMQGLPGFIPATPYGILQLIKTYNIPTQGKKLTVVGRSNIVGRPISVLLSQKGYDATVTLTHSRTEGMEKILLDSDIIVTALGQPNFLKETMVKKGVVVIDVGITRQKNLMTPKGYQVVGDVDFEKVSNKASYITPVPGGVGPMTIVMLLKNTLQSYEKSLRPLK